MDLRREADKKGLHKLVSRKTNHRVDLVEELFKSILLKRYGEEGALRAARKKPREAVLMLQDLLAGRPAEKDKDRTEVLCELIAKVEAARKELEGRDAARR